MESMKNKQSWAIKPRNGDPIIIVEAGGRRQALAAAAKALGGGFEHHSGSFTPVLIGAPGQPSLIAEPYKDST